MGRPDWTRTYGGIVRAVLLAPRLVGTPMIDFSRMTGNERDVLHAALKAYDVFLRRRMTASPDRPVHDDARWRRYVVAELLSKIDAR